jgi:uncharacterized protein
VEGWCPADGVRTAWSAWSVPLTSSGLRDRGAGPGIGARARDSGSGVNDLPGWNRPVIRVAGLSADVTAGQWLETGQFGAHDLRALQRHRDRVTADPVPLIAVSRSGTSATHVDAAFTRRTW